MLTVVVSTESQPQMGVLPTPPLPLPSSYRPPDWYSQPMAPRLDQPPYQQLTSTVTKRTPLPETPRGTIGAHQAGQPAPSSTQGRGHPVDSPWGGVRDPSLIGNHPQYTVPVTRKEALEAASGIGGEGSSRQVPPGHTEVYSGHLPPGDSGLAYDAVNYGQARSIAPSSGIGHQGGPSARPSAERDMRPDPGVPIYGSNPQQLINPQYAVDSKPHVDLRSPSLAFRHNPHPQDAVPQYHVLDSAPPGHYIPGNATILAPGDDQGMTLYQSNLQGQGPPGQFSVSVEPAYTHPAGGSPQPPIHHFPGAAQATEQGSPQGFGDGFNYSVPPDRAPHFDLGSTSQYSMADLTPQRSLSPQSNRAPLSFARQRSSQGLETPDPQYQQQALIRGHAGKDEEAGYGVWDIRYDSANIAPSSGPAKRGPGPDAGDEPSSRKKNQKKQRGAFSAEARQETSETRKTGACIRCRIQRARVRSILSPPSLQSRRLLIPI